MVVKAGQAEAGHGAGVPMQVSNSGSTDVHALVMFVLDATKPFSNGDKRNGLSRLVTFVGI
jgi:hypothetical protein